MKTLENFPATLAEPSMEPWAKALQRHRLGYPDTHIVRFLASRAGTAQENRLRGIDVGFGSGQHLRTLAEFGYETWGTELLEGEVARLTELAGEALHGGQLLAGHLHELPELRGQFDVALAWGVAALNAPSQLNRWLTGFRDLLKPAGRACLNFRGQDTWFHGLGRSVEPGCYLLDERAGPYANAVFTFLDEAGVRRAMAEAGFVIENLQRDDWWKNNLSEHHSWWIVWARKADA